MDIDGKKVLIVTMLFPNSAEMAKSPFVLRVAKELAARAQVKVIAPVRLLPGFGLYKKLFACGHNIPAVPRFEKIDGIDVYHPRIFFPPKVLRFFHGFIYFFAVLPLVRKIRKEFDFDLVNAPYLYPDGLAGVLVGKYFKKPVVVEALGCDVNLLTRYRTRRWLISYACRNAEKIITVNNDLKKKLMALGVPETLLSVITNGVDPEEFRVLDRAACRRDLGLPLDRQIVLFVGNLEKVKGIRYLIEAWEWIARVNGNALLVLVGDGSEKAAVLAQVQKRGLQGAVLVQGARPYAEIPVWMNAGDMICLPSIREGCPNVLMEAMACGKYIIASSVGGIPEIVTSPATGLLVPPENSRALATALEQALARRADAAQAGGIRSWKAAADERLGLFRSVMEA